MTPQEILDYSTQQSAIYQDVFSHILDGSDYTKLMARNLSKNFIDNFNPDKVRFTGLDVIKFQDLPQVCEGITQKHLMMRDSLPLFMNRLTAPLAKSMWKFTTKFCIASLRINAPKTYTTTTENCSDVVIACVMAGAYLHLIDSTPSPAVN